jgi:hypothetical protein
MEDNSKKSDAEQIAKRFLLYDEVVFVVDLPANDMMTFLLVCSDKSGDWFAQHRSYVNVNKTKYLLLAEEIDIFELYRRMVRSGLRINKGFYR